MLILAIDPGPERSAAIECRHYGQPGMNPVLVSSGIYANDALATLCHLLSRHRHTGELAIEMVACYGMPVGKEVFETCLWVGRFIEAWGGTRCTKVYRRDIKLRLCGSARAKDANIRQALIDKFPKTGKDSKGNPSSIGTKEHPGPLYGIKKDMWSALAVAVTWAETHEKEP